MEKRKTGTGRNTDSFEQHAHLVAVSGVATIDRIPAALVQLRRHSATGREASGTQSEA